MRERERKREREKGYIYVCGHVSFALLNGISTFVGYLMPKSFLQNSSSWDNKGVHSFLICISTKVKEIVRQKCCTLASTPRKLLMYEWF